MYVDDVKNGFYDVILGKRLFLMVHYDIDSICACKILQNLLKFNHVLYSLAVIQGLDDMKTAYTENCKEVKYFILINCGGTIDLMEFLEPEDDIVFFVLDSHRPTDLCNIYSNCQIRLLGNDEKGVEVPDFHDVFKIDSEGEEEELSENEAAGDEVEERSAKRRRLGEEAIIKRRERKLWEEKRNRLLLEYSQFSYHAKASAICMFHLAWKLSRDEKEMLWLAIVAATEQYVLAKVEESDYNVVKDDLRQHSSRIAHRSQDTATSTKITYESDLRLVLYRHWSVEESLKHSPYSVWKMHLWSLSGRKKVLELFAEMGYPLVQCRQDFRSMDLQFRKDFQSTVMKCAYKYELSDIVFDSFLLQFGYRNKYSAQDMVYALLAVLECPGKEQTAEERFNLALDFLTCSKAETIKAGVEKAKDLFKILFKTVQCALEMKQVVTAGPYMYFLIQESSLDWQHYSQPHILMLLAQFLQKTFASTSVKNWQSKTLPLVVSAPKNVQSGTCLVLGIPPLIEESPKSFLGKAFEQVSEQMDCDCGQDFIDSSYCEIFVKDRPRFFDALTAVLKYS